MGLRIAYYRKRKGYTQEELAKMIGISWNYLAQIEAPRTVRGVSLEILFKISDALDVQPGEFIDEHRW